MVRALTSCATCPHCICFCIGFIEPFEGQPYKECVYAASHLSEVQLSTPHAHSPQTETGRDDSINLPRLLNNRKSRRATIQRG